MSVQGSLFGDFASGAEFDPADSRYRYRLWRTWGVGDRALWVMLNPSTADAEQDDPTIRRCIGFTKSWGMSGLIVCNLFAFRSTDPDALYEQADPVGPGNDAAIRRAARDASIVVAAWGSFGGHLDRDKSVLRMLGEVVTDPPTCLGITTAGFPRHPLYVAGNTPLIDYTDGRAPHPHRTPKEGGR